MAGMRSAYFKKLGGHCRNDTPDGNNFLITNLVTSKYIGDLILILSFRLVSYIYLEFIRVRCGIRLE